MLTAIYIYGALLLIFFGIPVLLTWAYSWFETSFPSQKNESWQARNKRIDSEVQEIRQRFSSGEVSLSQLIDFLGITENEFDKVADVLMGQPWWDDLTPNFIRSLGESSATVEALRRLLCADNSDVRSRALFLLSAMIKIDRKLVQIHYPDMAVDIRESIARFPDIGWLCCSVLTKLGEATIADFEQAASTGVLEDYILLACDLRGSDIRTLRLLDRFARMGCDVGRKQAIEVLGACGRPALPVLAGLVGAPAAQDRESVARQLGRFGARAVPLVLTLLKDRSANVTQAANDSMRRIGKRLERKLKRSVREGNDGARSAILAVVAMPVGAPSDPSVDAKALVQRFREQWQALSAA